MPKEQIKACLDTFNTSEEIDGCGEEEDPDRDLFFTVCEQFLREYRKQNEQGMLSEQELSDLEKGLWDWKRTSSMASLKEMRRLARDMLDVLSLTSIEELRLRTVILILQLYFSNRAKQSNLRSTYELLLAEIENLVAGGRSPAEDRYEAAEICYNPCAFRRSSLSMDVIEELTTKTDIIVAMLCRRFEDQLKGPRLKRERVQKRNEEIGKAMDAGITKEEDLFRHMRENHEELMRKGKNGYIGSTQMMREYRKAKKSENGTGGTAIPPTDTTQPGAPTEPPTG
jgi:hypothetical protein